MPSATVFYHYFYPDDVVSAVHVFELCEELTRRGWAVTAMPCNRSCREEAQIYPRSGQHHGVEIRRIWRPPLSQSSTLGRFLNAVWMVLRWSMVAFRTSPDFIIVGTDPVLSVCVAIFWKLIRPRTRVAHWCFDLYPEAAVADGLLRPRGRLAAALKGITKRAYASCDLLADIGPCMSNKLRSYEPSGRQVTLTPWALSEPDSPLPLNLEKRDDIFGDASLMLMYSGNFGRAHSADLMLQLAGKLEKHGARLAFSVRGNRVNELRQRAAASANVVFVPFAAQSDLEAQLSAADIHVVSLREEWTGTVVPSKFFGALAVGRPVLFVGSPQSSVAKWIREYRVGWVLTESNFQEIINELIHYCNDASKLTTLFTHCHEIYQTHFSKQCIADQWDRELRSIELVPAKFALTTYGS